MLGESRDLNMMTMSHNRSLLFTMMIFQVLAIKKFDPLSFSERSDFVELVTCIFRLRQPSICEIKGYCAEPGHYMMVYEHHMNRSLYEFLHLSDDYSKPLTWDTRVRIALGTAQALE